MYSVVQHGLAGQRVRDAQQGQDDGHADVDTVVHLIKVGGARVVVHVGADLVDAGQRMQHRPSNWLSAAVREWTVRPNLRSPQKPMVK